MAHLDVDDDDDDDEENAEGVVFNLSPNDFYRKIFCREYPDNYDFEQPKESLKATSTVESLNAQIFSNAELSKESFVEVNLNRERTELQKELLPLFESYSDVLLPGIFRAALRSQVRDMYVLHVLTHALKSRRRVLHGTRRGGSVADSGFRRPHVLVILPIRGDAYDFARRLIDAHPLDKVHGMGHFEESIAFDYFDIENRPDDYVERFSVNPDDNFWYGIKLARDEIRLNSGLDSSDILFASPLGLRRLMEGPSGSDFLASIEIMVLDSCEMLLMQNLSHLEVVMEQMNQIPKDIGQCDISRLTSYALNGKSKFLRQTIFVSEYMTPELVSLSRRLCFNRSQSIVAIRYEGHLGDLDGGGSLRYMFQRIPFQSVATEADARFEFFKKKILPKLLRDMSGILIWTSNYFDFLKLRKLFDYDQVAFGHINEFTKKRDIRSERADFYNEKAQVLLLSERFHFYNRQPIRGIQNIVFYNTPITARFMPEMVSLMKPKVRQNAQIITLYSKLDKLAMERLVGSERYQKMSGSEKEIHMFLA